MKKMPKTKKVATEKIMLSIVYGGARREALDGALKNKMAELDFDFVDAGMSFFDDDYMMRLDFEKIIRIKK